MTKKMNETIAIGCDSFAKQLKKSALNFLNQERYEIYDINEQHDFSEYYNVADEAGRIIGKGDCQKAILFCGTGMGMAIMANKHKGVYAAVCESVQAAKLSRIVNNANILTIGAMLIGEYLALEMIKTWLSTDFASEFSQEIRSFLVGSMPQISSLESRIYTTKQPKLSK
mmetsp:Transcript_4361/g.9871  ORF Transcript_4361/g.9871 Transcript_4361/m.9871 type:complete len:170 (-) Transcript_4361:3549-4058(-)